MAKHKRTKAERSAAAKKAWAKRRAGKVFPAVVAAAPSNDDPVNHPKHYTNHPSGVECIQVTEHMSFNLGNAVKYIWRVHGKGNLVQDLQKARWYLDREIARLK